MRTPIKLITPEHGTGDVVEALEFVLDRARNGDVHGLAYVAQLRQRRYIMDTAGDAQRNPLQALGMVQLLADEMIRRTRGE